MRNRIRKSKPGSSEFEASCVCSLEFLRYLFCGLAKHPAAPSLCCVDLSTTVLRKYDLSFVDSFEGFRTAPQPDRIYEIRCVMIMMVVGDGYDPCLVCRFLNPFPGLISLSEFSWMRHQPEPRS